MAETAAATRRPRQVFEITQAACGTAIASVEVVPYRHPFRYDILPGSSTGFYFAGGALIGSTLSPRR